MKRFGLLHHPKIPESQRLAKETEANLLASGASAWRSSAWDDAEVFERASSADLLMTFGGDGTIVRVARITAGLDLPIVGVNLGRLGFLAEVQPWELPAKLQPLAEGRYWLEERMMLRIELRRDQKILRSFEALNDAVIARGRIARVVRIDAHVEGQYLTTYTADGVIAATPTGSTAYSLAAGGPIVAPCMCSILLTPIAPHLNVARALVLPSAAHLHFVLSTEYEAALTVDGQVDVPLLNGDSVLVTASPNVCRFARLGDPGYFYRTLLERLK